jgi:hypothetical protein
MDTFEAKLDNQKLTIEAQISSDALLDGSSKIFVTIYHEDTPRRWRKIDVQLEGNNRFTAIVEKSRLQKRPIIKIRTNYIVDAINLKESIVKVTTVKYAINDGLKTVDFVSKFETNTEEFDLGTAEDETFSITKRVKVALV